jgi:amino acid adenylation domain-containing protein
MIRMDLFERISKLSPRQRKLLETKLKSQDIDFLKIPVMPVKREGNSLFPLSREQEQLWILEQFDPDQTAYVIISAANIEGEVHIQALEQSVAAIVRRHESLRTVIQVKDQRPVQCVLPSLTVPLERRTVDGTGRTQQEERVKEILRQEVLSSFDLERGPQVKTLLFELSGDTSIFLVLLHHIIADGTSVLVFLEELAHFYHHYANGMEPTLPELPVQYIDYCQWQHTWFGDTSDLSPSRKRQEDYWLEEMKGELPVLDLPVDFPRPAVQSFKGNSVQFRLSPQQSGALKRMALNGKTTVFNVLLAMFYVLLAKLSNGEDILLGTPLAGRRQAQIQTLIGMFVKTLVLRNYPREERSFVDFLREVTGKTVRAFENQEYQYEDLVRKILTRRDISRNPLFDVMFAYYNMDFNRVQIPGLTLTPFEFEYQTAKFDLSLLGFESGDSFYFSLEYCTDLFKEETVRRFVVYFKEIISALLTDHRRTIGDIPLMPVDEKIRLLENCNEMERQFPDVETVHKGIFQRAERIPDCIAIVRGDRHISYKELILRVKVLAASLGNRGVEPNSPVGLIMGRSLELAISILGIMAAGGMYIPIDPEFPPNRIDYILKTSAAKVLLTQEGIDIPEMFDGEVVVYRHDPAGEANDDACKPSGLAYCIFTSGSTGNPKGVVIRHFNILNYYHSLLESLSLDQFHSILCLTTISFDIFVTEFFVPLLGGLRVVLADEMEQKDPMLQRELILRECVDVVQMTPSRQKLLLADQKDPATFQHVKLFLSGGETFPAHMLPDTKRFFHGEIVNLYGPTETTVFSSFKYLTGTDTVTIGKAIANTSFYVVNKSDKLQPPGVTGELLIGGDGVAAGYLNNPQLTAEKFIANPFIHEHPSAARHPVLYRSGDLVRRLDNGELDFVGRIDFQVKIRGFRVELEEVEELLTNHEAVEQAVVTAKSSASGENVLCAYYVAARELNITELREFLAGSLPGYMIPAYFVAVDAIPLTHNKKIDRAALPDPVAKSGNAYVAPGSQLERTLANAWAAILGLDPSKIGVHDNFFELGGNSFELIRLRMRLSEELGEELPAVTLFQYPTIHALCAFLSPEEEEDDAMEDGEDDLLFDAIQAFEED